MTLRYYYRDNDGDVVEITNPSRIRRGGTEASYNAEEGSVGAWELEVDDPDGTFNVRGFRILYAQEDEAVADDQHGIIGVWYTGERYISRMGTDSPAKRTERGRTWRVGLHDINTRLSWRINVGNDCERPEETDLARVAWLMDTNEMGSWLDDDTTYIDSTDGVTMDAVDYTGQALLDVCDDCAQQSGRNFGLLWEYSGDAGDPIAIKLWYKFGASEDYPSEKKINNVIADVEADPDALFPSLDATLNRSPSRVAWGVYQVYDGGATYQTLASTATRFNKIDVVGRGENVKTLNQATGRAMRYLNTVSNVETDRIEVSVLVDPTEVNSILPFHRLRIFDTALPGYGERNEYDEPDYEWMRVVERTVRDIAPGHYELGLTLMAPSLDEFPADEGGGDVDEGLQARLFGNSGPHPLPNGPIYWDWTGDRFAYLFYTNGPFDFTESGLVPVGDGRAKYEGIEITADGTLSSVTAHYSAIGVGIAANTPYTITWDLCLNGVSIDTYSEVFNVVGASNLWVNAGPILSATNLAVTTGDVISCRISCLPAAMEFFRVPWGIDAGYIWIKGGAF